MSLLNYTSEIDADKTVMQISKCLSSHGASAVMTEYDPIEGQVTAISFKIKFGDKEASFRLPTNWRPVYEILIRNKKKPAEHLKGNRSLQHFESEHKMQAVRTAWRIVKDWVEAQMALVETQMVTTGQVFLPYMLLRDGKTVSEKMASDPQFLLGDGK